MKSEKQKIIIRKKVKYSAVQALYFAVFAVAMYQTVFLQEVGFTSSQIGMMVAIGSVCGLVTMPLWGVISDRLHSARGTFLVTITATALLYSTLPLFGRMVGKTAIVFYLLMAIIYLFRQPANSLMDSWCISELSPLGVGYGSVRMFGSLGFSVIAILLGVWVGKVVKLETTFYTLIPMALLLLVVSLYDKKSTVNDAGTEGETETKEEKKNFQLSLLLTNKPLICYLIYAFGLYIYSSVTVVFFPYILTASNCDPNQVGLVTGFRALLEILAMYAGSKMAKKIPLRYVMILPGVLFGLENMLYMFASNLSHIMLIMIFSGLAGGFTYSLGPSYIYEIVPEEVSSTAQTGNAMIMTLVTVVGNAAGGYIIHAWGVRVLTTGCGIIILALTVFFVSSFGINRQRAGRSGVLKGCGQR